MAKPVNDPQRQKLAVNAALNQAAIFNSNFRQSFGNQGADTKRPCAWREYGWPDHVGFKDFYNLYDRQGVAYGVVNRLTDKCFETNPWVIEGDEFDESKKETPWDKEFKAFAKRSQLWQAFHEADRRRLVGRYSGMILQIKDGGAWDQPVTLARPVIKKIIPAWEGQLEPVDLITDQNDENYGEPTFWQYKEGEVKSSGDTSIAPRNLKIHPDRIIIIGDWREGRSYLKAAYNSFVNLEKIEGGSGEGFLKNASNRMGVNFDAAANLQQIATQYGLKDVASLHQAFNDAAADLNNGIDRLLITQGATVQQLVSQVPDPTAHYGISIQTISASTGQAAKIISGMQSGERASTEDLKDFNKLGQGRRTGQLSTDARVVVEHVQRIKMVSLVPGQDYEIMWDDLTESSQGEKLGFADTMATVNQKSAGGGDVPPFTNAEIREAAGYEGTPDVTIPKLKPLADVEPVTVVKA